MGIKVIDLDFQVRSIRLHDVEPRFFQTMHLLLGLMKISW